MELIRKQWCGFCPVRFQDLSASPAYISFNSEVDRLCRIQELGWEKYYIFSFTNLKLKFSIFQLKCRPQTTYHHPVILLPREVTDILTSSYSTVAISKYLLHSLLLHNYGSYYNCCWFGLFNNELLTTHISQFLNIWWMYFNKSSFLCNPAYFIMHLKTSL